VQEILEKNAPLVKELVEICKGHLRLGEGELNALRATPEAFIAPRGLKIVEAVKRDRKWPGTDSNITGLRERCGLARAALSALLQPWELVLNADNVIMQRAAPPGAAPSGMEE
jgi:hypothetical protein